MTDSLATKNDLEQIRKCFSSELGTLTRELSEHRKQLQDNDFEHAAARKSSDERWQQVTASTAMRTRLWAAAFAAASVVIVAVIQTLSNHSYAVAREQMREVTRVQLVKEHELQMAHDELLIKRTLDERDRRIDQLIIQARQSP
jgi:Skp family chaperone for outer membrane proteins